MPLDDVQKNTDVLKSVGLLLISMSNMDVSRLEQRA